MATSTDAALPVIRARDVRLDVPADRSGLLRRRVGTVRAVHGLDVAMHAGEAVWLVGMPGDGADQAGRLLALELPPTEGVIELEGRSMSSVRGRTLAAARRTAVRIGADGMPDLDPRRTPCEIVAAAAAGSSRSVRSEHTTRARDLLARVGLPDDQLDVRAGALAEPERRLVGASRLLAQEPKVVVYEPASLEQSARDDDLVWAALTELQHEASIALVIVARVLPDHLGSGELALVLCGGRVVEVLGPRDLAQSLHPFTVALTSTAPRDGRSAAAGLAASGADRSHVEQGCPFRASCPWAKARCASELPRLRRPLGATHDVACHFPEDPPRTQDPGGPSSERVERSERSEVPPGGSEEPTAREFAEG